MQLSLLPNLAEIYVTSDNDMYRYALGNAGSRTIGIIGANPSIATNIKTDMTIRKIKEFCRLNGFDGWIMFNIYPQRSTNPKNIHDSIFPEAHRRNVEVISRLVNDYTINTVLACWGDLYYHRRYFEDCLREINASAFRDITSWLKIGELTKKGQPKHPSRLGYEQPFTSFNISEQPWHS